MAVNPDTLWLHLWKAAAVLTLLEVVLAVVALTSGEGAVIHLVLAPLEAILTAWLYMTRHNRPTNDTRRR